MRERRSIAPSAAEREDVMSRIVVLGAGLGGVIMAYEMKEKLGADDELTVVNLGST